MSVLTDIKILYHLALAPVRGSTHAQRLESFYGRQAAGYDGFRERLLRGRQELIRTLEIPERAVWIDMGGGTGANLEAASPRLSRCEKVYVVDLAPSLLNVARERIARRGWRQVETVSADATWFQSREPADLVTFSYSLTMIPDWFAAIDNAWRLLKPGGTIGVVDFFVSRKHADAGRVRHSWLTRNMLPLWFGSDNVFLSADHAPYLHRKFEAVEYSEHKARIPYLPLVRVPYYVFIGRKRGTV